MAQQPPTELPNKVLYCQIMEQLKWRLDSALLTLDLVAKRQNYLRDPAAIEFVLLQLRICCELLALGCAAIHTDVERSKTLQDMWNANDIMKKFNKLKSEYFPEPVVDVVGPDGLIEHQPLPDAITKEEFLKHYHFFGSLLHAGTFETLTRPEKPVYDVKIIHDFIRGFIKLLNSHTYHLYDRKKLVRVIMNNVTDGKVWLNELDAIDPMPSGK